MTLKIIFHFFFIIYYEIKMGHNASHDKILFKLLNRQKKKKRNGCSYQQKKILYILLQCINKINITVYLKYIHTFPLCSPQIFSKFLPIVTWNLGFLEGLFCSYIFQRQTWLLTRILYSEWVANDGTNDVFKLNTNNDHLSGHYKSKVNAI